MINEILLESANRFNQIAMLNTLYPPTSESSPTPTPQLTARILNSHRDGYFQFINAVHAKGTGVLEPVIRQGAAEGDANNWPQICETLHKYLILVNDVIDECVLVNEPASLEEAKSPGRGRGRKFDSGVSFGSSTGTSIGEGTMTEKELPQFPAPKNINAKTGSSILERLAREVRALGANSKARNLRKMKSTTTLNARPGSQQSHAESSFFEIDDHKRKRLIFEANYRKNSQSQLFTQ
jgi:hypothetical protein